MNREIILPEELLKRLKAIDEQLENCANVLAETIWRRRKMDDFVIDDLILIIRLIYLTNCDLQTNNEQIEECFKINLKTRFLSLITLHKILTLSPQTEEQTLRELAMTAKMTRDIYCPGKEAEYINNFIVTLTIEADRISYRKKIDLTS